MLYVYADKKDKIRGWGFNHNNCINVTLFKICIIYNAKIQEHLQNTFSMLPFVICSTA